MPLPQNGENWPPTHLSHIFEQMREWSAWYSNDLDSLTQIYGTTGGRTRPSAGRGGLVGAFTRFLPPTNQPETPTRPTTRR